MKKIYVGVPTVKQQNTAFQRRMRHEKLPIDWRTSPRFRRDYPMKDYIFDLEKRRFTDPFWYMLGFAEWLPEIDIVDTKK